MKLLEEQKKEKEIQKLKANKRASEYYYNNREYVLQRQAAKKFYNKQYYSEWYQINKDIVNNKRRNKTGAEKRVNTEYKKNIFDNSKTKKSFTLVFN